MLKQNGRHTRYPKPAKTSYSYTTNIQHIHSPILGVSRGWILVVYARKPDKIHRLNDLYIYPLIVKMAFS